ncbi:MAG: ABC-2 family transporter protein [Chloroflexi bacterium]|nr:ABC-2 family transporter protein [Chloroflexota bacterium]
MLEPGAVSVHRPPALWAVKLAKYWHLAASSAQNSMAYRRAMIVNLAAVVIRLLAIYFLWTAAFAERSAVGSFQREDVGTYLVIAFVAAGLLGFRTEMRISRAIRDGNIVMDLVRPYSFQGAWLAQTLGALAVEAVIVVLVALALGVSVMSLHGPAGAVAGASWVVSLLLAMLIKFGIAYLIGLTAFAITEVHFLITVRESVSAVMAGTIIPISLFPDQFEAVVRYLPFYSTVGLPTDIYLGTIAGTDILTAIALQLAWVIAIWTAGVLLYPIALRKVTIHGG